MGPSWIPRRYRERLQRGAGERRTTGTQHPQYQGMIGNGTRHLIQEALPDSKSDRVDEILELYGPLRRKSSHQEQALWRNGKNSGVSRRSRSSHVGSQQQTTRNDDPYCAGALW